MNYHLNNLSQSGSPPSTYGSVTKLFSLMSHEKGRIFLAFFATLLFSGLMLVSPIIVGWTVDHAFQTKDFSVVLRSAFLLLGIYLVAFVTNYGQVRLMGGLAQRMLFRLRNSIFRKLQDLPVAFFHQNKSGDLISRINNDTDRLNQFFSQSLMQFVGTIFMMTGVALFVLILHPSLGSAGLAPAVFLLFFTRAVSGWVKRKNSKSLEKTGNMSAEIQESLTNFKVIVAFHLRSYFREKFQEVNRDNFSASTRAGMANNVFTPIYDFASHSAQLIVFCLGIYEISQGRLSVGLLISFSLYMNRFYEPVRQLASLWATFQTALAAWERISLILSLASDMTVIPSKPSSSRALLEFKDVSFHYPDGQEVLHAINFSLEAGKTYALVGPTGGGKTTTASLMARLFDPSKGEVWFDHQDIRSYEDRIRTQNIGFILQEPFLFSGTVGDNLRYGHDDLGKLSDDDLEAVMKESGLDHLLSKFDQGLSTPVPHGGETISLGQKQLIAFLRAVLRKPKLLILDEATANVDTVTEQLLEEILQKLPKETTRVIIAHRLNTIENADEIFFVNSGEMVRAGSLQHAVALLLKPRVPSSRVS